MTKKTSPQQYYR